MDAGIDEPEQKWPATNTTLSLTNWLATATACFGSQASSPIFSTSFLPITPPLALMSATAISAPRRICSPKEAYWPVIGPAVAMVICDQAAPPKLASAAARTILRETRVFMGAPPPKWVELL